MVKGFSRLSLNLWNSGVATLTAGALYRGIVNLSGRSTTMDQPYYYLGVAFLALALISLFFVRSVWIEKTALRHENVRFLKRTDVLEVN